MDQPTGIAVAPPGSTVRSTRSCRFGPLSAPLGFSLVEVLIATGLLATAMASLAHLFAIATRANMEAGDTTWATVLAMQKIEELRAGPFPALQQSVDYLGPGGNRLDDPGATRRAYTRHWWIEPLPSAPDTIVMITVAVSRYRHGDADESDAAAGQRDGARLVTLLARRVP